MSPSVQTPMALDIPSFPLQGSRLIEASAGTGKTFTIALLYARLILDHGRPLDEGKNSAFGRPLTPPDILVVTFTEAATEELKDRIRARLVEAAHCFMVSPEQAPAANGDPLLTLRDDYDPAHWPQCARRLQLAAEWMDEAAVSTIHGWCYRMLREHAFDTGNLFNQTLVTDQTDLVAEVVRDYWRIHFYPLSTDFATEIGQALVSPDALLSRLRPLLTHPETLLTYADAPLRASDNLTDALAARTAFRQTQKAKENTARDLWLANRDALHELLQDWRQHMYKNPYLPGDDQSFADNLAAMDAWAEGAPRPALLKSLATGRFKLKKSAKGEEPTHPAFEALADLLACEEQDADGEQRFIAELLAHARDWVSRTLAKRLQQRAELGFDDMLRALDNALQGPGREALAQRIQQQYPVAMVDEFQDTDPLQYRILDAVYRIEDNTPDTALIMIGDPKQAIYSFRGADIHTYLKAREATAGRHYTLSRNFRSTRPLVEAINAFFQHAEQQPLGAFRYRDTAGDNPLPFNPVDAQGKTDQLMLHGESARAFNVWLQPPDTEDQKGNQGLTRRAYYNEMAASTASQIVGWLNDSERCGFRQTDGTLVPLKPADIAILVRSRSEAEHIRTALADRQLPSVYLSDRDSVFDTQQARDMLFWLRACADPGDEQHLRTALATSTLNWSLSELDTLNQNELAWEQQVQRFRDYRRLWREQGVLPMLHRLMHDNELPRQCLQRPQGERQLTNLLHLAEWLQQTSTQLDGEHALIRQFSDQLEQTDDEQVLRLESDAELIKVVTIHKSKGLEYPLVCLPFISTWRELNKKQTSISHRFEGQTALELADPTLASHAWEQAEEDRLSEDLRLLYVAVTRASHALWLTTGPLVAGNGKTSSLHNSAMGYALAGDKGKGVDYSVLASRLSSLPAPLIDHQPPPEPTDALYQAPPRPEITAARSVQRPALERWWVASYSALASDAGDTPDEPESPAESTQREELDDLTASTQALPNAGLPGDGLHRFPRGPEPGTFLHGLLEWAAAHETADQRGFAAALADRDARRDMLLRRCTLRGWTDWVDTLDTWLAGFLDTPWTAGMPSTTPMRLADLQQQQPELEFWFEAHAVEAQAVDDLVQRHTLNAQPRPRLRPQQLNGLLKGFIDLVYEHDGQYFVADWKSNHLGINDQAYSQAAMEQAVLHKRYDLQYVIYVLALHRLLQARLPDYDYDRDVGGAVYVFLRGHGAPSQGLFSDKPPRALIEALDRLFQSDTTDTEVTD